MKTTMAVATTCLCATAAHASLIGTDVTLDLRQTGLIGGIEGPSGGVHLYGTTEPFGVGALWTVTSPAPHPAHENSLDLDLGEIIFFGLAGNEPALTILDVSGLAETVDPSSIGVYQPHDIMTDIGIVSDLGADRFTVTWEIETILAADPDTHRVIIGWNSIPGPGGAAGLLTLATARRRRR